MFAQKKEVMLKQISTFAAIALIAASCSIKEDRSKCPFIIPVNVHLSGFSMSQKNFPGTKTDPVDPMDYGDVNTITLAFYSGDTEVYKATQSKSDATSYTTFGDFSLSLRMGSYTMVAIAYTTKEGSPFTLTSPTSASFTGAHVYDTFLYTRTVNIPNADNAVGISATLNRIVSGLKVVSTDGKTSNVTNVRMTLSAGGRSFNPTTGLATVNTGFANTVGNSAAVGNPSTSSTYFFLATDEQTMNVTIETLDADGNTLSTKTVNDVPFKRNRITQLSGPIYTNSGVSGGFQLNTDWLTEYDDIFS